MSDGPRSEIREALRWAARRLGAVTALTAIIPASRIYIDEVKRGPDGNPTFPYILGNFMGGNDVQGLGTARQQTQGDFQWRVVTEGPPDDAANQASVYMDQSLQSAAEQVLNGFKFSSRRVAPIDRPEWDRLKNKSYRNTGGIYRIWISVAP